MIAETGTATSGELYHHHLHVVSEQGEVRYQLQFGPEGMSVDANGIVSWTPSEQYKWQKTMAVFKVTDKSRQEQLVAFLVDTI